MVPLLVFTYQKRPAWRVPIGILIVILLSSPLIILIYNPLPLIFGGDGKLNAASASSAMLAIKNWPFFAPNSSILPLQTRKHGNKPPQKENIDCRDAEIPDRIGKDSSQATDFSNCTATVEKEERKQGAHELEDKRV